MHTPSLDLHDKVQVLDIEYDDDESCCFQRVDTALWISERMDQQKWVEQWKGNCAESNDASHQSVRQTVDELWKETWQKEVLCVFLRRLGWIRL